MFMEQNITPFGECFNTIEGIHRKVKKRCNEVMDIKDVRVKKLAELIRNRYDNNAASFARAVDRSSSQVNDTLAGRKSFGEKFARHIEQKLNLPERWMDQSVLSGEDLRGPMLANARIISPIGHTIPLISWVKAGLFCEAVDLFEPGAAEEWLPAPKKYGPHAYALRIEGDSMVSPFPHARSYPPGYIIFVDPDRAVVNGSRVIAKLPDTNEATFKIYSEDGGKRFLKPINPQYPIIEMTEGMILCGVVVGGMWEE
jgi:SOS-response transcriptional repressor LexA